MNTTPHAITNGVDNNRTSCVRGTSSPTTSTRTGSVVQRFHRIRITPLLTVFCIIHHKSTRGRVDSPKMPAQQGSLPQVEMPAHGVAAAFPVGARPASDMGLTMGPPKVVTKATATRYRSSSRAVWAKVLDELCELTGWQRDHAHNALREAARAAPGA